MNNLWKGLAIIGVWGSVAYIVTHGHMDSNAIASIVSGASLTTALVAWIG